jgi:hypothetical protein
LKNFKKIIKNCLSQEKLYCIRELVFPMGKAKCLEIDSFPVVNQTAKVKGNKMKKLLSTVLVLGSAAALSACTANGESANDLDGPMTGAPYSEERTIGDSPRPAPVVRSAQPVFEKRQVK